MITFIHEILYNWNWAFIPVSIGGIGWSAFIIFKQLTAPKPEPVSRRKSHKAPAQHNISSTATMGKSATEEAAHIASSHQNGQQSSLLDDLKNDSDLYNKNDTIEENASEFQHASTKVNRIDPELVDAELINDIVDSVTNIVTAQIEELTGTELHQSEENKRSDIQDMLETVQEGGSSASYHAVVEAPVDDSSDIQDILDTVDESSNIHAVLPIDSDQETNEPTPTEGEHTAAIRKANRMEEIGFHRSEDTPEDIHSGASAFEEAAAALLGENALEGKHLERLGELGLLATPESQNDENAPNNSRLHTAEIDDILGRLDDVLDMSEGDTEEVEQYQDGDIEAVEIDNSIETDLDIATQDDTDPQPFNLAETVQIEAQDKSELYANPLDKNTDNTNDTNKQDDYDSISTQRIENTENSDDQEIAQDDDEAADFFGSALDEQDQNKKETESTESPLSTEEELAETVAVTRDDEQPIDPNMETIAEESNDDSDDDDLPAWARADTFDDDLPDEGDGTSSGPKQEKLF